jgi:hypothetical protein
MLVLVCASASQAQTPLRQTEWLVRNMTRVETWRFFEPPPGGGDPTSTYVGTRFYVGVRRVEPRVDLRLGAVYFDHAGAMPPGEFYLNISTHVSKISSPA